MQIDENLLKRRLAGLKLASIFLGAISMLALIFGIIFGLNTLIGSSIIILSTLYIVRREAKIQKNKKQEFEQI